ncbi:MAG: acyl-CoA reductase [Clostridiales bacterium]|nr:acyl-CoA reductase [Clostridiales bacterium]
MILYKGNIYQDSMQDELITRLESDIVETLSKPQRLTTDAVIAASEKMYQKAANGYYDSIAVPLLNEFGVSYERYQAMAKAFSAEVLRYKCEIELGRDFSNLPPLTSGTVRKIAPLGLLFHVAAGNVDGLPAYSVAEGLLSGNINILKLPSGDTGLSVKLLSDLIAEEPSLAEYIYVFDVPSTEFETLKRLAKLADGVVVWGGDMAQRAAREMCDVTTKIIPWGHKLSFAYATKNVTDEQLKGLACHICATEQVLCSSCQGIFYDTDSLEELQQFARRFFEIFKSENNRFGKADMAMRGRNSVQLYNDKLENKYPLILNDEGVSVVVKEDRELELSYTFRNVWVKALPHDKIVQSLKKQKGYLQTCGLLCDVSEKQSLADRLISAGVVRVTGGDLSRTFFGEAHDGTYPLREYTKIVEIDV